MRIFQKRKSKCFENRDQKQNQRYRFWFELQPPLQTTAPYQNTVSQLIRKYSAKFAKVIIEQNLWFGDLLDNRNILRWKVHKTKPNQKQR